MVASAPEIMDGEDDLALDTLDTDDMQDETDLESPELDGHSKGPRPEQVDLERSTTNEKHKRRLKLARLKKKAKEAAYEFSGLSDLAGVLFLEIQKVSDLPPERNSKHIFYFEPIKLLISFSDPHWLRYGSVRCHIAWQEDI